MSYFKFEWCVLDTETNIRNRGEDAIGNMAASPWHSANGIVMIGTTTDIDEGEVFVWEEPIADRSVKHIFQSKMLVGHNIKFDLHYLRKEFPDMYDEWMRNGGMVWDTMVVEYLLSGQEKSFPSLNYCANKYGGTQKDDKIKEYWDQGIDTSLIPIEELADYLVDDVKNTAKIFEIQYELVEENKMFDLVATQMDALLALEEIEWNGIAFDVTKAQYQLDVTRVSLLAVESNALRYMEARLPAGMAADLNVGSPKQVSTVLFGGEVKVEKQVPVLNADGTPSMYKSGVKKGMPRYKKEKSVVKVAPMVTDPSAFNISRLKSGIWATDDESLKSLLRGAASFPVGARQFILDVLKCREYKKDISTYYEGFLGHVWEDGMIHASFNQAQTSTGRLSCTQPNLQNITEKDID